jgi:hypothetical protein
MPVVIRAFPIRRPHDEVAAFAATLNGERKVDTDRFYRQFGVSHESWYLQDTANGPLLIGLTVVDDPQEAAPRYAGSSAEFDAWFKERILHLTGIDVNKEPLGPPTTQVFDWTDPDRTPVSLV